PRGGGLRATRRGRPLGGARPYGAARERRDRAQAELIVARRAHAAGAADRAPCRRRPDEPRDRGTALPQPPHDRLSPAQGLHQAADRVPPRPRAYEPRRARASLTRWPTTATLVRCPRSSAAPPSARSAPSCSWSLA